MQRLGLAARRIIEAEVQEDIAARFAQDPAVVLIRMEERALTEDGLLHVLSSSQATSSEQVLKGITHSFFHHRRHSGPPRDFNEVRSYAFLVSHGKRGVCGGIPSKHQQYYGSTRIR